MASRQKKRSKGIFTFVSGPMFAGKSTYIINSFSEKSKKETCLLIKFSKDTRYGSSAALVSHDGLKTPQPAKKCSTVQEIIDCIRECTKPPKNIFIDELQFFTSSNEMSVAKYLRRIANNGINVFAAGLDLDSTKKPWPYFYECVKCADLHIICLAKCSECGIPAQYTMRTIKSDEQILIGGAECYVPVCEKHFK